MAQNSRPVFRSPSLEQETVEELSRRLLEITAQLNASNRSLITLLPCPIPIECQIGRAHV